MNIIRRHSNLIHRERQQIIQDEESLIRWHFEGHRLAHLDVGDVLQ